MVCGCEAQDDGGDLVDGEETSSQLGGDVRCACSPGLATPARMATAVLCADSRAKVRVVCLARGALSGSGVHSSY